MIDVSSQRLSEAQLGFNHGRRIGSAFAAQRSGDPHGGEPVAHYNKYSLTRSYLQPFPLWGESLSFDSLLSGQKSESGRGQVLSFAFSKKT